MGTKAKCLTALFAPSLAAQRRRAAPKRPQGESEALQGALTRTKWSPTMAQDTVTPTTIPGGVHRETILSQFPLSSRVRSVCITPPCQQAHRDLMASLSQLTPHNIVGYEADRFDIMERADHLKAVLSTVYRYTKTIVQDTAHFAPTNVADE